MNSPLEPSITKSFSQAFCRSLLNMLVLGADVLVSPGTNFVIIGKVRGHDGSKKGGWLTRSSGTTDVHLRMTHENFPVASGIAAFCLSAMTPTNSSLFGIFGAPLLDTTFPLCAMPPTHSSLSSGEFSAPLVAAAFRLSAMPLTNSALHGSVGAPVVAAAFTFHPRAVPDAKSALNDIARASIVAAAFHLVRAMPPTNSSLM